MSDGPRPTILVVDQERAQCERLSTILRRDYEVHSTTDPQLALALAEERPLDAVLVDQSAGTGLLAEIAARQDDCVGFLLAPRGAPLPRFDPSHVYRCIDDAVEAEQLRLDIQRAIEHRETQRELARTRGMACVGSMVGSVIHDLRNFLVILRAAPDLLEEGDETLTADVAARLRHAERNLGDLSEELLSIARGTSPRYELVLADLGEIASKTTELIRRDPSLAGRTIALDVEAGCPAVLLSRTRVERLLINILRNACEATDDDGHIRVAVRRRDDGLALVVQDDGPGMTAQLLERIFEPLFTTRAEAGGTGLGLAICRTIMRGHDGHLSCTSEPGEGARFAAWFPLVAKK